MNFSKKDGSWRWTEFYRTLTRKVELLIILPNLTHRSIKIMVTSSRESGRVKNSVHISRKKISKKKRGKQFFFKHCMTGETIRLKYKIKRKLFFIFIFLAQRKDCDKPFWSEILELRIPCELRRHMPFVIDLSHMLKSYWSSPIWPFSYSAAR